jgi:hypothetical protein
MARHSRGTRDKRDWRLANSGEHVFVYEVKMEEIVGCLSWKYEVACFGKKGPLVSQGAIALSADGLSTTIIDISSVSGAHSQLDRQFIDDIINISSISGVSSGQEAQPSQPGAFYKQHGSQRSGKKYCNTPDSLRDQPQEPHLTYSLRANYIKKSHCETESAGLVGHDWLTKPTSSSVYRSVDCVIWCRPRRLVSRRHHTSIRK